MPTTNQIIHLPAISRQKSPFYLLVALLMTLAWLDMSTTAAAATKYRRVVALSPFQANTLAQLGVKPIAIGGNIGQGIKLDRRLNGVKRLTLSHPDGPNLEEVIKLNPGLVLSSQGWKTGNTKMTNQGFKVLASSSYEPSSPSAVASSIKAIGKLVGKSKKAKKLAAKVKRQLTAASSDIVKKPTVLLILGIGRSTMAFMPKSWGGQVINHAGGQLLTDGLDSSSSSNSSFASISDEEIISRNPDIIIVVPHGTSSSIQSIKDYFAKKPGWESTTAVSSGNVFVSDPSSLLQASTSPGSLVTTVRNSYLKNR